MEKDNISISILINHAYGLGSPARREFIKKTLQEDADLRIRYEGILQLINEYPDKDPEEMLDNMAAEIKRRMVKPVEEPVVAEGRVRSIPVAASHKARTIPVWVKWAAAVLFVALIIPVYNLVTRNSSAQYRAQQIADTPYGIESEKGDNGPPEAWKESFKKKDYAAVISELQSKASLPHEDQFYLGLSYLKIKPARLDDAQAAFQKAAASGILFRSEAWLYLGVVQILKGSPKEAEQSLKNSEDSQATELLARLRK